jgi:hypothetical protein
MRLVAAAVLALIGCSTDAPGVRSTIEMDSTRTLVFRLAAWDSTAQPRVDQIMVATSRRAGRRAAATGSPAYWAIVRRPDVSSLPLPTTVRYGTAPSGYTAASGPVAPPLPPGPYELDVKTDHGHAVMYFRIGSDGRVK